MNQEPSTMGHRLGDRLRYLRTLKSMTQAELAQKLDISLRQYNRVERGESQPTIALLERICAVLDSCLSTLFLVFDAEGRRDCLERAGRSQATCGHSLTGMWALRTPSGPPRWSASLYQLLGYTPFSVKPTLNRFLMHVSPEDQSVCKAFIDAAQQPENIGSLFLRVVTKSSEKRFVMISRDFLPGEGTDTEPYIFVQDVTDRILMDRDLVRGKEQLEKYVREKNSELELSLERYQQEIVERIKAEEFLNIYKMMVMNSNDAQLYVNIEGIIVIANVAYEKLINIPAEKIIGRLHQTFISRNFGDAYYDLEVKPCMDLVLLRGMKTFHDGWISLESGRRYLSQSFTPCRDGEKMVGVIITVHDLTHLMIARDQLAESEARFRNLLANVPNVAVQGYRMDGTTFYWNQASEQIYGYSAEEVVGRNLLDLIIPPEMREEFKTAMRQMAQTGEPIPASELWLMRKDGSSVPVYSSHAVVQKKGALPELFCIDIDLTERKLAEKAVRENEQTISTLVDTVQEGIALQDSSGKILIWNAAASNCFHLGHEEVIGQTSTTRNWNLIHEDGSDFPGHDHPSMHSLRTGEPYRGVIAGIRFRDEPIRWIQINTTPLFNADTDKPWAVAISFADVTELKRMTRLLRNSNERLRSLYENTPAMLHSINDKGEIVSVSNMWLEKLGYDRDEVMGRRSVDFLTEESRRRAVEMNIPRFFETGSAYDLPYQMMTKDGRILDVLMSGVSEYDEDGVFLRSMAVTQDVTERRKAEKALVESERRFRALVENLPVLINAGTTEPNVGFTYWNKACEAITGYSQEEALLNPEVFALMYPDQEYREQIVREWEETKGQFENKEIILTAKDGSQHCVAWSNLPRELSFTGKDAWAVGVDITQRKLAERAVLDQKSYLRAILDTTRDGFCIIDLQGHLVDVNEAYCHMSGYAREELLRMHIKDLDSDETPSEIAERVARIITNGCELFEVRQRRSDEKVYNIEASASLLNMNGGQIVCFLRDITDRKQAEAALRLREQLLAVAASAT